MTPDLPGRSLFTLSNSSKLAGLPVGMFFYSNIPAGSLISFPPLAPAYKHTSVYSPKGLLAGAYDLRPYAPTEVLHSFLTLHTIHPVGWAAKPAKTKAEVDALNSQILGYTISSSLAPLSNSAAHLIAGPLSRVSSLGITSIRPDTLDKAGVKVNLAFKSDDFVIYHALNTFTLLTLTSLPPRLQDILTAL